MYNRLVTGVNKRECYNRIRWSVGLFHTVVDAIIIQNGALVYSLIGTLGLTQQQPLYLMSFITHNSKLQATFRQNHVFLDFKQSRGGKKILNLPFSVWSEK